MLRNIGRFHVPKLIFDCEAVVLAKMYGLARPTFDKRGIRLPSPYTPKD